MPRRRRRSAPPDRSEAGRIVERAGPEPAVVTMIPALASLIPKANPQTSLEELQQATGVGDQVERKGNG
jgi:hypothetical protein